MQLIEVEPMAERLGDAVRTTPTIELRRDCSEEVADDTWKNDATGFSYGPQQNRSGR